MLQNLLNCLTFSNWPVSSIKRTHILIIGKVTTIEGSARTETAKRKAAAKTVSDHAIARTAHGHGNETSATRNAKNANPTCSETVKSKSKRNQSMVSEKINQINRINSFTITAHPQMPIKATANVDCRAVLLSLPD